MDWSLRLYDGPPISVEDMYSKDSPLFTMSIHHSGKFDYDENDRVIYAGGTVDFTDNVDPDLLSVQDITQMGEELGIEPIIGCWYRHPEYPLHIGLTELANDRDVVLMTKWVPKYRVIDVYLSHCQFPEDAEPLSTEYPVPQEEKHEEEEDYEDEDEDDYEHCDGNEEENDGELSEDSHDVEVHEVEDDSEHNDGEESVEKQEAKDFGMQPDVDKEDPQLDDSDELISLQSSDKEWENEADREKKNPKYPEFAEDKDVENP